MKHVFSARPRWLVAAAAAGLGLGLFAPSVGAQSFESFGERIRIGADVGIGNTSPDLTRQPVPSSSAIGLSAAARVGVHVTREFSLNLVGSLWPTFGERLRVDPAVGLGFRVEGLARWAYLALAIDASAAFTEAGPKFQWMATPSLEFAIANRVSLGPFIRYIGQMRSLAEADRNGWAAGISFSFHPPPAAESHAPAAPVDTDRDGVNDPDDLCPAAPAGDHPDPVRRGCPIGDADGDGVLDNEDQCIAQAMGEHPDPARRGCPANDTDSDGVFDPDDQCVDAPQGSNPDPARRGCPTPDTDGDGVLDPADQCVREPAGEHPDPARAGCPIGDRDNDSVLDNVDHCPDQPGAPHPDPNRNGCPGLVTVTQGQIRISQQVFFATNSDQILPRSFPVLQAVADAVSASPQIRKIAVNGHTDDVGPAARNMTLSERRAQSVVRWLTAHTIAAERLESHGFGPTRPLVAIVPRMAPAALSTARAQNRRVEFVIIDPPQPLEGAAATPATP